MNLQPVLWPMLLAVLAAFVFAVRIVALRQLRASRANVAALWRWGGMSLAAVLLLIAAVRPVIASQNQTEAIIAGGDQPNVFLIIDRSADMAVPGGAGQPRMMLARNDIDAVIDRYPKARFAVIEFASTASLNWPLSADTFSLRPVLSALSPDGASQDALTQTNVGAPNNVLRYQLIGAVQQYPHAPNLVFYFGAGAPEAELPAKDFDLPEHSVDGGAVLDYGTATLQTVAEQIGVPNIARTDNAPLGDLLRDADPPKNSDTRVLATGGTETYWLPTLGAAVLILIELYLTLRDFRRSTLTGLDALR
jgi:Ca-activated chloride channel family protein